MIALEVVALPCAQSRPKASAIDRSKDDEVDDGDGEEEERGYERSDNDADVANVVDAVLEG